MKKGISLFLLLALLLTGCGFSQSVPSSEGTASTAGETLTVHYIDVGQADCILLECAQQYMLVDGGNVEDSSLVVAYLQKQGVEELELVVCTHAHEDHVGGLSGVLAVYPTGTVWAPTRTYSSGCFDDFVYYVDQQGLEITIPVAGDGFDLGTARVTVLGPTESYADPNDTSIILLVEFGENRFLFTGDMETAAENDMLDYWGNSVNWNVDVLKVGHHGSNTSTGYRFLYEVDPEYAVISVGEGNSYNHPHEEPMSRLRDADVTVYRTDEMGTILAVSDGENITFSWEKTSAVPEDPAGTEGMAQTYIGNVNSKVVHLSTCANLPSEKNQVLFESYEEAVAAGYHACSNCLK